MKIEKTSANLKSVDNNDILEWTLLFEIENGNGK